MDELEKERKRKMAEAAGGKVKKVVIYAQFAKIINLDKPQIQGFPAKYYCAEPSPGAYEILRDRGDGIVAIMPRSALAADLAKFVAVRFEDLDALQLTAKEADECVLYWRYTVPSIPMPSPLRFAGETELAFAEVPAPRPGAGCPTWDALLSRMTNANAFRCWIWSLLQEDSFMQQYVWLYGEGNDGKGSINRFLQRIFGPAYCSKQPRDSRFWSHELLGKRLVVFPDCNNTGFITSGYFKSLTGGDPIGIEPKNEKPFTVQLKAKYLVLSNERPSLSSEKADMRRVIYCEMAPREDIDDPTFETRLWEEGGAFLAQCQAAYMASGCSASRPVPVDHEEIADWVEQLELPFMDAFRIYFKESPHRSEWITGEQLHSCIKHVLKTQKERSDFIAWLARRRGVRRLSVKNENNDVIGKRYVGLAMKPTYETFA